MWCTNCRDNVLNFEFVFVPKSPSYTTYEKETSGQEQQLIRIVIDYSQLLGSNSTSFALYLALPKWMQIFLIYAHVLADRLRKLIGNSNQ